jgi:hypothetical protein
MYAAKRHPKNIGRVNAIFISVRISGLNSEFSSIFSFSYESLFCSETSFFQKTCSGNMQFFTSSTYFDGDITTIKVDKQKK